MNDHGEAVGIGDDYRLANQKRQDADGYENWLTSMLPDNLGKVARTNLSVSFIQVEGHEVCRVDVTPSKVPIFICSQKSSGDFYVRLTNSTRRLNTADAMEYIRSHWS